MAKDERPKPPAWLSTAGSRNARTGKGRAIHRSAPAAEPPTPAPRRTPATKRPSPGATTPAVDLSDNARVVLERRYLARNGAGRLTETPEQLFRRVAHNIALAEAKYVAPSQAETAIAAYEAQFYDLVTSLRFLPNSPTLGNAGRPLQQLSACFVLPVEDSMVGIFDTLKNTALIHQSGGGTGFAFSRLRPAGDIVASTGGIASGPVSFMRVYDAATESIKQGGTRRGANMAILNVEHPDIEAFINVKANMTALQNFNISVAVTERFMQAVERNEEYALVNPRTGSAAGNRQARAVFRQIVENAWRNGDPGIVFLDRINRDNPTPQLGRIEATNPCGEQPLLPYESCNLGSLNVSRFVKPAGATKPRNGHARGGAPPPAEVDWDALAAAIPLCVRFLDDVIDQNSYPIAEIDEMTRKTRKIGLGVMGWADLLFALGMNYDSDEAVARGGRVMSFIRDHADRASTQLATERGVFPAWSGSVYDPASGDPRGGPRYRNATRTTVAPTGTLSIIADCSGGIEPAFALAFMRQHHLDRKDPSKVTQLPEVNRTFRSIAESAGFYTDDLARYLAEGGSIAARDDVPAWARRVFVTSHDIAPEWHVKMQAAFQRHTDNAVSKTINFRNEATVEDVEHAYLLAFREGCKGITVYRDGSRHRQVLSHSTVRGPEQAESVAAEIALGFAELLPDGAHPEPLASTEPRAAGRPYRRHLPDERRSITHKFRVGDQEGYVTAGLYEEGAPGEIFVNISKEGSTIRGLMDAVAMLTSIALQYGVPLENLVAKFRGVHFEPAGLTGNPKIPVASSLVDYIFRWLELRFLAPSAPAEPPTASAAKSGRRPKRGAGISTPPSAPAPPAVQAESEHTTPYVSNEATSTGLGCPDCGSILVFAEGCLVCRSCGYNKCG